MLLLPPKTRQYKTYKLDMFIFDFIISILLFCSEI